MTYPFLNRRDGSGSEMRGQAGEDLGDRKIVYWDSNGLWRLADADATATMPTIGFTIGAILSGNFGRILLHGLVGKNGWTWTRGAELYASTTAGEITHTIPAAPNQGQIIGVAYEADVLYFDPKDVLTGGAVGCAILEGSTAYVGFDDCKEYYTNYFYCDGAADDVQIQAAITYISGLGGGRVLIERGTYDITVKTDITTPDIWVQGTGTDTILRQANAINSYIFDVSATGDFFKLSDIQLDGNVANNPAGGRGVNIVDAENVAIQNCYIHDFFQHGVMAWGATHYLSVINNKLGGFADNCIYTDGADYIFIHGNHLYDTGWHAIGVLHAAYGIISNNRCYNNTRDAAILIGQTDIVQMSVVGNFVYGAGRSGILVNQVDLGSVTSQCIVSDNIIIGCGYHGIELNDVTDIQVTNNFCYNNSQDAANTYHGISLTEARRCLINGNVCSDDGSSQSSGIYLSNDDNECLITGNYCNNNVDTGIRLNWNQDKCAVISNYCSYNGAYGITLANANVTNTVVKENALILNVTAPILDSGTNTRLATHQIQFIQGTTFISTAANPWGWEIDADTEFAIGIGWLPTELQQVVRIRVIGAGLAGPGAGNYMRIELTGEGATFDEVYTTNAIDVVNHNNEEINFAANDVIQWIFTAADDVQIGTLLGGDRLQIKVLHEAAGNGDIATDAIVDSIQVEYV